MAQKPSIPKGTRDFNPEQVAKRNYIFNTIRGAFETFGFQPIETPSFENSETLMGKYGDEGDRLIFKILNSGDFLKDSHILYKYYNVLINHFNKEFYQELFLTNDLKNVISSKIENPLELTENEKVDIKNKFILFERKKRDLLKLEDENLITEIFYQYSENIILSTYMIVALMKKEFDNHLLWISHINRITITIIESLFSKKLAPIISEKALRYDLTVPFARYVVQHQNEIEFPFKRYQIQPVWRADRPQKGRFREFYQCDADVVGSKSLWQEVEFIQLYDTVFSALKLEGVTIKINNRKILSGIAEIIGASDKLIDFTVALDKLDKIGEAKVKEEMLSKGISEAGISKLQPLFTLSGSFESQIESLKDILSTSEEGKKGIEELAFINEAISELGLKTASLQLDVTLARGLNYYTGAIFEVAAPKTVQMGSIGGGGRYDDLTGIFGLKDVSGVGISFGLDRIYLVLEELGLFPETVNKNVDVLFINFGDKEALFCLKAIKQLRSEGIHTELYPDADKMKKQMNHANKRNIPFVVLVGEAEVSSNSYTLKNMVSGEQFKVSFDELLTHLK
ncbi:Histidine--tRNA ligase [Mariniflexile rhizosphaerae]|uniref:histidine--tRNA ligase n=1 Tax=unclassified Mariniflexile TaxID=2643887 RepID=UPI000CA72498|nr:histidine--tRNA ligase [Mariniflexile sp. TRM1-10]AXP81980.1 Histidine--tRNA ligase [Mariniflexile sp. TRM1-10]PLB19162.1 MAG: Histidine-tRNA ligase [Flavobacteriaceae bacterium FS1-H7996/R]